MSETKKKNKRTRFKQVKYEDLILPKDFFERIAKHDTGNEKYTDKWIFFSSQLLSYVFRNGQARVSTEALNVLYSKRHSEFKKFLEEMGYLVKVKNHSTDARLCATYVVHAKEWVKYKMPEGFKDSKAFRGYEERLKRGLFIKEDINIARLSNDADFNLTSKRTKKGDVHKSKEKIESKNHKFSKMDRGCRFHNVFTNCVKKYRKDMEHKGKKVKEIDIRCCFPLLMTCLYGDKRYSKGSMFDKVINRADERREFRRYVDFLDSKPFYKTIGISKKTFGIALFSEMSGIKWERNKLISYLKKHFPLLYYRIKRFRAATSGKALALLLQRWESHIMIENVLTKADFGAIPVHDGILVSEENERKALDLIKEAFRKCLQIKHLTVRIGNKTKKLVSQGS